MAAIAERIGIPLMAWQLLVASVGGELDPRTGLPAYREVAVTVPRQSGKTTLILVWMLQRVLGWGKPQTVVYSAQTGKDAREKLLDDLVPLLEPHRKTLGLRRVIRTNGSEKISFVNGSRIILLTGMADAGHGKTVDLAIKDEFFADVDDRRDQALIPAMMTRADAQVLTMSNMGTEDSAPLNRKIEQGRLAVGAGASSGLAYFEWSADMDADPDDPATWWSCMPALGYTVTEEVVRHARMTLTDGEFRRAFLNQLTKADERVLPQGPWEAVCDAQAAPVGQLVFSIDVNPERTAASIVASSGGDTPTAELVDHHASMGWILGRARELTDRHGGTWVVDGSGPAGSLIPDLERAGITVHPVTAREMIDACGWFYDGVMGGTIRIRKNPRLDEAAAGAAKRQVGDAWAWTRKNASADISPLVAATLAIWGATHLTVSSVYEDRDLAVV
jgi:hypothetical protein